jgi:hypothetical protein
MCSEMTPLPNLMKIRPLNSNQRRMHKHNNLLIGPVVFAMYTGMYTNEVVIGVTPVLYNYCVSN